MRIHNPATMTENHRILRSMNHCVRLLRQCLHSNNIWGAMLCIDEWEQWGSKLT